MVKPFYFPLLFLTPDFDGDQIGTDAVCITRRKWETSTFDLATLATRHILHLPYQLMDVLLGRCNLELRINTCDSPEDAGRVMSATRLGLYAAGMSPFLSPLVATHSLNDYSGINSRDSEDLKENLPEGLREGLTSDKGTVEVWPRELSFQCIIISHKLNATGLRLANGVRIAHKWIEIVKKNPALKVVEDAANDAPKLGNRDQSLLHIWTAIEALFPSVSQEVSFRLALYLAQLIGNPDHRAKVYENVKKAYNVRSKVAHGSARNIDIEEWLNAWTILMSAVNAIVERGTMPTDAELLAEVLAFPAAHGPISGSLEHEQS